MSESCICVPLVSFNGVHIVCVCVCVCVCVVMMECVSVCVCVVMMECVSVCEFYQYTPANKDDTTHASRMC